MDVHFKMFDQLQFHSIFNLLAASEASRTEDRYDLSPCPIVWLLSSDCPFKL